MKSQKTGSLFALKCRVNGETVECGLDTSKTLLEFIRGDLGLKGTKEGCGEGECGACIVLVDGKAVNSCLMMAVQLHGKHLTTIEGLKGRDGGLHPLQKAFMEEGAVQCGFCTPGMILAAEAVLREDPEASNEEIRRALAGNLCRCTGYEKILGAVEKARGERK